MGDDYFPDEGEFVDPNAAKIPDREEIGKRLFGKPTSELTDEELAAAKERVYEEAERKKEDEKRNGLPKVCISIKNIGEISKNAWAALEKRNHPPSMFVHAGSPCRLVERERETIFVDHLTLDKMRHEAARAAKWYTHGQNGKPKLVFPPKDVIADMLASPEPPLPRLDSIVYAPVFSDGWELNREWGYNSQTGVFSAYDKGEWYAPELKPGPDDVRDALALIEEMVCDYQFATPADHDNYIGLFLLTFCLPAIRSATPLHLIESSTVGTGKTLLARAALFPAMRNTVSVMVETTDAEEWRKRITSLYNSGQNVIWIDNVQKSLNSPTLAAAISATHWTDRVMGRSEHIRFPVKFIWLATANNARMSTDMARRTVRIRVLPDCAEPWLKTGFKHPDLIAWVTEKRKDLIEAALTLIASWARAGRPAPKGKLMGSFEDWSRSIGGILEHVGLTHFLGNGEEVMSTTDDTGEAWSDFIRAWFKQYNEQMVTTKELFEIAKGIEGFPLGRSEHETNQKQSLGIALNQNRERIFFDLKVMRGTTSGHSRMWYLQPVVKGDTFDE